MLSAHPSLTQRLAVGLTKLDLALRAQAWRIGESEGLTPTQGQILANLRSHPASARRVSDIAAALGVTPQTASEAVAALVGKRLVEKRPDARDRRATALSLTPKGRSSAEKASRWPEFLLTSLDALSPDEQIVFLKALVKMIRTLQVRGQIPVSRMCVTCRYFRPNAHPDKAEPHHCAFVDAPFADRDHRLDCADHEAAPLAAQRHAWRSFAAPDLQRDRP
jgi:DNA-binding MarR family transcriptional regulator